MLVAWVAFCAAWRDLRVGNTGTYYVQPKAVMFPTDAKLLDRARERLVRLTT